MSSPTRALLATASLVVAALPPGAWAGDPLATPTVIETTPTLGARDVDPSLDQLMVRFDVPMNRRSWSWCGGGAAYPQLAGPPTFVDEYTAALPVTLEPQKTYYLGINCPSALNFRSAEGISAQPLSFRFTTGGFVENAVADRSNADALDALEGIIERNYSYADRTGTDWPALFAQSREWVLAAPTREEWVARVGTLLEHADDPHLYFRDPGGQRISTHLRRGTYNGNNVARANMLPGLKKENWVVTWGRRGDVGYLAIDSWESDSTVMQPAQDALAALADTKALVLDVRANGGGNEDEALRVASWFVGASYRYATHRFRNPDMPGGWSPVGERWVHPNKDGRAYDGYVVVLQGPVCLSSNEAFLLAMRGCRRVTFVGATSGGSSGNPRVMKLPNGFTLTFPTWQSMTPDGEQFEGIGLRPDIEVDGDFRFSDPVLAKGLELAGAAP